MQHRVGPGGQVGTGEVDLSPQEIKPAPEPESSVRTGDGARPWLSGIIDVDQPIAPLPTGGASRALLFVVSAGRPIGQLNLALPIDPYPAELLADAIARQLAAPLQFARLAADLLPAPLVPDDLSLGVLVCTRDRAGDLDRCLRAICDLEPPPDQIVVVDNGSTDQTRAVATSFGARFEYVAEPATGLDRARNRGLLQMRTDVVLFTDDDVQVDRSWAVRLAACFADPLVMAATGLVLPAVLDTAARQRFERYAGFSRGYLRREFDGTLYSPFEAGAAGAGASMAFRTAFLRSVGGFPEELDAGMPTGSGGDSYALGEVLRAGYRIVYEPAAWAWHTHRSSEAALHSVLRSYGNGLASALASSAIRHRQPVATLVGSRHAARYLGKKLGRSVLRRPGRVPLPLAAAEARGALDALTGFPRARRAVAARGALPVPPAIGEGAAAPVAASEPGVLPSLSVVIPSRGRRESLVRLLRALDDQAYADGKLEFIVALDGDVDGSAAAVRRLRLRRPMRVVELSGGGNDRHHGLGPAIARNEGARRASNDVLVFLDDDVIPAHREVLMAHGRHHAAAPLGSRTVIGPCPPATAGRASAANTSLYGMAVRNWWIGHVRRLTDTVPLTFADVGSGNLSLARATFGQMEGFAPLARREDWELGYRLARAGKELVGAGDASVFHDADLDPASGFKDRFSEGRGDAAIARRHPEFVPWSTLGSWDTMQPRSRRTVRLVLADPDRRRLWSSTALPALAALDAAGLRRQHAQVAHAAAVACYWAGVGTETQGLPGWISLLRASREASAPPYPLPLEEGAAWVAPQPGAAADVVVTFRGEVLGTAPVAWGGVPWRRDRFLEVVISNFAATAGLAELVSLAGTRPEAGGER